MVERMRDAEHTSTVPVRIIPCLDVRDGRVVKGVRFEGLRDAGDPVELAAEYERQGADEVVILDVSATLESRRAAAKTVEAVRAVLSIPLTVGGGVRTIDDAQRLLAAGADKVSVNTAAVERPELLSELAERFGVQCVVIAIDAKRSDAFRATVVTRSGSAPQDLDATAWAITATEHGAGEILLTSMDRDGTGLGYDTELITSVANSVRVPIIASGGARTPEHFAAGLRAGAGAVLAASIFHFAETTVGSVKQALRTAGIPVRLV